jgi:hypothetical protein
MSQWYKPWPCVCFACKKKFESKEATKPSSSPLRHSLTYPFYYSREDNDLKLCYIPNTPIQREVSICHECRKKKDPYTLQRIDRVNKYGFKVDGLKELSKEEKLKVKKAVKKNERKFKKWHRAYEEKLDEKYGIYRRVVGETRAMRKRRIKIAKERKKERLKKAEK